MCTHPQRGRVSCCRMARKRVLPGRTAAVPVFNAQAFLHSSGTSKTIRSYGRGETIFTDGDTCEAVLYIQTGGVRLSTRSRSGSEAVLAILGPGDFFGEGCLAGQIARVGSATAITPCVILLVGKAHMMRLLHREPAMSDRFIAHMLSRNIRIEEDLIDEIFHSSRGSQELITSAKSERPSRR